MMASSYNNDTNGNGVKRQGALLQGAENRVTLPSSSSSSDDKKRSGRLVATILSAYDLPSSGDGDAAQPSCVSLTLLDTVVKSGPPSARHRDRNSFKFTANSNGGDAGGNELVVSARLSALYSATATFRVEYEDSSDGLVGECHLNVSLCVNEPQWLILHLSPESKAAAFGTTADEEHPPTLRVRLLLTGPYRPEVSAIISLASTYFRGMDSLSSATSSTFRSVTDYLPNKVPAVKYLLVPIVPFAVGATALLPVVLGGLVLGLPFFLPLLIVLLAFAASIGLLGGGMYLSTEKGRHQISGIIAPVYSTFLATPVGQRAIYDTGPRPSPVTLAHLILPQDMVGKLIVSLIIDFIGSSSYLIPGVGEVFDVFWAPMQTVLIMAMYDDTSPNLKYVSFVEEILPFTDFIPSATMGWMREFGPGFFNMGRKKASDLSVLVKSETAALRR